MALVIWYLLRDLRLILIWIYNRINCKCPEEEIVVVEPEVIVVPVERISYQPTTCLVAGQPKRMVNQDGLGVKNLHDHEEEGAWKHQYLPNVVDKKDFMMTPKPQIRQTISEADMMVI